MKQVMLPGFQANKYRAGVQRYLNEQLHILSKLPETHPRRAVLVSAIEHTRKILAQT